MILVDTSVWVDHLRAGAPALARLLEAERVLMHPFVLGELACGNLHDRRKVLALLQDLPQAPAADEQEVLLYIDRHALHGRGIGYVDVHLLAAATLHGGARLWTRDRRLRAAAESLSLIWRPA